MVRWLPERRFSPDRHRYWARLDQARAAQGDRSRLIEAARVELPRWREQATPHDQAERIAETLRRGLKGPDFAADAVLLPVRSADSSCRPRAEAGHAGRARSPGGPGSRRPRAVSARRSRSSLLEAADVRQANNAPRSHRVCRAADRAASSRWRRRAGPAEARGCRCRAGALVRSYAAQFRRDDDRQARPCSSISATAAPRRWWPSRTSCCS